MLAAGGDEAMPALPALSRAESELAEAELRRGGRSVDWVYLLQPLPVKCISMDPFDLTH